MHPNSARGLKDSVFGLLETERQAFWQAHHTWSEEQRNAAWSQQRADLAFQLMGDTSADGYAGGRLEDSLVRLADQAQLVRT